MRAIVIGGSMAGLLCARVLSDVFDEVVVIDRDTPPDTAEPRKGVPQGRHVHALLSAGADAIGKLFPGLYDEMMEGGSNKADIANDSAIFNNGSWRLQIPTGAFFYVQTRPFLEMHVRRRVAAIPNVQQRFATSVTDLIFDDTRETVIGIRLSTPDGVEETLTADFVADCSGRGSKSSVWLEAAGYAGPPMDKIAADVGYATRFFRAPPTLGRSWVVLGSQGTPPEGLRHGIAFRIGKDQLQVTVAGHFHQQPPGDPQGFLDYVGLLETRAIHDVIRDAEPLSEVMLHRFPVSIWRHYERLTRFPRAYIVFGDAVCSFNPVYGQGMSVAALGALELQKTFADLGTTAAKSPALAQTFFRRAAHAIKIAWTVSAGADLIYAKTEGVRPPGLKLFFWYIGQIMDLASYDPTVVKAWADVHHLRRPVSHLLRPAILARVIGRALWGGAPLAVDHPLRVGVADAVAE